MKRLFEYGLEYDLEIERGACRHGSGRMRNVHGKCSGMGGGGRHDGQGGGHGRGHGCGEGSGHGRGKGMGRGRGHGKGHGGSGQCGGNGRGRQGRGAERFSGARRISADELQNLTLALLVEKPLHGYQIIKELEELSHGFYKPSPGMIYPVLAFLEESNLALPEMDGAKKLYTITEEGQEIYAQNRAAAEALLEWLKAQGQLIDAMETAYEAEKLSPEFPFRDKMQTLRGVLRNKRQVDAETHEAIVQILEETIAKIETL